MENLPESVSLNCVCLVAQEEAVAAECEQGCAQVSSVRSCLWGGGAWACHPLDLVTNEAVRKLPSVPCVAMLLWWFLLLPSSVFPQGSQGFELLCSFPPFLIYKRPLPTLCFVIDVWIISIGRHMLYYYLECCWSFCDPGLPVLRRCCGFIPVSWKWLSPLSILPFPSLTWLPSDPGPSPLSP